MTRKLRVARLDKAHGFAVWDGFAFEPDGIFYPTWVAAQDAADRANAEASAWNRAGLSDAPHMDAA